MRALGVDFGQARIGIAVGVDGIASPRPNLTASGSLAKDAQAIQAIAAREEVEVVVVGIPGMEDGKQARICGMLADRIEELGVDVVRIDESLSSVEANALIDEHDLRYSLRKKAVDGLAACLILERFFRERPL